MNLCCNDSPAIAGAKAGLSTAAAYRIKRTRGFIGFPAENKACRGRRRADPLANVWDNEVVPMLRAAPGTETDRRFRRTVPPPSRPQRRNGRTLERRVRLGGR